MSTRSFFTRVEALRAVGAALVAAHHFSAMPLHGVPLLPHLPWSSAGELQNTIGRIMLALLPGHAALMMFFVISGFVLRVSLEYGPQEPVRCATRFCLARLFRFYPIVLVAVAVGLLMIYAGFDVPREPANSHPTIGTAVANFLLLDVSLNPHFWAFQLELLMAPIIVSLYLLERRYGWQVVAAIAVITTLLSFSGRWAISKPLSTQMFVFIVGMLIPTIGRQLVSSLSNRGAARLVGAAVLVLFGTHLLFGFYSRFTAIFETYAAAALISIAAYRSADCLAVLDWRPLQMLGRCAGSFYVLHILVAVAAFIPIKASIPAEWVVRAPIFITPVVLVVLLGCVVPLAVIGYRWIEAPGVRVGQKVIHRLGLRSGREQVPAGAAL